MVFHEKSQNKELDCPAQVQTKHLTIRPTSKNYSRFRLTEEITTNLRIEVHYAFIYRLIQKYSNFIK